MASERGAGPGPVPVSTRRPARRPVALALAAGGLLLGLTIAQGTGIAAAPGAGQAQDPTPTPAPEPPFWGTIFLDPDILTPEDPSSFTGLRYAGRGMRQMYDRRVEGWVQLEAYLFDAAFDDGLETEIQVNPELGSVAAAEREALRFAEPIGRLPTALRADVETVWIHRGRELFGGGNRNLLIHTDQAEAYIADGILEETFVHEAAHTSLDETHASAPGWLAAQAADPTFISVYARDHPAREDIAESFLPYLALRHRRDRIDDELAATIESTIPNRIAYFDAQAFDLHPMEPASEATTIFLPALQRP